MSSLQAIDFHPDFQFVVGASVSHDDEAVSKQHTLSKRHLQPVLNQLNRFLGTEILSTKAAPESLTVASVVVVPSAGVIPAPVPAVVLPVTKESTTGLPSEESTTAVSAAAVSLLPVHGTVASESSESIPSSEAAS